MRSLFLILFVILSTIGFSQEKDNVPKVEWNGYAQIRASSNLDDNTSFILRRMKLWLKSTPGFSDHWSYKIQAIITSFQQEKFFLQDVKLNYKTGLFSFDIGQFVPQYSLQWFQPDYKIGSLGIRDIGIQANFETKNKFFKTHLGVFNGYGIKEYRLNNQGYMVTNKSEINIPIKNNKLKLGYSLQYRYAQNLQLRLILPDTALFSGNDFRYNLFAMYKSKVLLLQAEFLNAELNNSNAYGYYFLSVINFRKNQIVLSFEKYQDLIVETTDNPYYRIGYNYLIKDYKIKLSFDNYFQISNSKIDNYFGNIQLQLFFK